jgi:hypothetical protein
VDAIRANLKPGESISVGAYALELYNEDLRDLSLKVSGWRRKRLNATARV